MKFASNITRVPFGRTDVLLAANEAPSLELSCGHDLNSTPLQGVSKVGTFLFFAANRDRQIEKATVGFGSTEVSLRLPGILLCAPSSRDCPRVVGFERACKGSDSCEAVSPRPCRSFRFGAVRNWPE